MEIRELIENLEKRYPFSLQEEWDNSGLQIGNPEDEVKNVLVSLDLEEEGIEEAREIKDKLKASGLVVYGDTSNKVNKIAVCGGAGSDLIRDALDISCDMIITGDVKYHDGMDLANEGIIICDVGHFASENHIIYKLQKDIEEIFDGEVMTFSKEDSFRKFY